MYKFVIKRLVNVWLSAVNLWITDWKGDTDVDD